jgi:PPOX class probable F420-dependent enzyme
VHGAVAFQTRRTLRRFENSVDGNGCRLVVFRLSPLALAFTIRQSREVSRTLDLLTIRVLLPESMNPESDTMTNSDSTQTWTELDSALLAKTLVITTFRRSGVGVPTGIWAAKLGGKYYFTTPSSTAKVKRLAHTARVTFGPGDSRGRIAEGAVHEAVALPASPDLLPAFRAAMRKKGPIMSRVIEIMYKIKKDQRLVYELTRP